MRARGLHSSLAVVLAVQVLVSASCSNDDGPDAHGSVAALEVLSGDAQSGVVGAELPEAVVVRAVDGGGRPVPGQIVNFRVVTGGGTVFAGAAISDRDGQARERWTLGTTAGPQVLEARAVDSSTGAAIVFASFEATAIPGPAAHLVIAGGNEQSAEQLTSLPAQVMARVTDAYGNGVGGVSVDFVSLSEGGTAAPPNVTTDASGHASTTWTLGPSLGAQTLEARSGALSPVSFSATATVGPVRARVSAFSGGEQTGAAGADLPRPVVVQVTDLAGAPIGGVPVTFEVIAGGGSITPTATTIADGTAAATWRLGSTAGSPQRIEARSLDPVSQLTIGPVAFDATAVAGPPGSIKFWTPSMGPLDPSPHRTIGIWVEVRDEFANPVPGAAISFVPCDGCGTATPDSSSTDAYGYAGTSWTHGLVAGDETIEAVASNGVSATYHHGVIWSEIFDGHYPGAPDVPGCGGSTFDLTVQNGLVWGLVCAGTDVVAGLRSRSEVLTIDPSGAFAGTSPFSMSNKVECSGTLTMDVAGNASVAGSFTYVNFYTMLPKCSGTWSARRDPTGTLNF